MPQIIEKIKRPQDQKIKLELDNSDAPIISFEKVIVNVIIPVAKVISCFVVSAAKSKAFCSLVFMI